MVDLTMCGKTFRLVAVYAPSVEGGWTDYFRDLEKFLVMSFPLVILGGFNTVCDASVDCGGSNPDRTINPGFRDLLKRFCLVDPYRSEHPDAPVWTWSSSDGSSRSYIDRILVRPSDRNIVKCPHFSFVSYSDHRMVTSELTLDKIYKQGSDYWKLNTSLLAIGEYRNRIKLIIQRALTSAIINNKWWYALKRAIRFESTRYSIELASQSRRVLEGLVRD